MADAPAPTPAPGSPPKPAGRPTGKQLLILIGGGFVLMFGGCLLAIANAGNGNDITIPFVLFAIVFFGGALMMVGGLAAAFINILLIIFRKPRRIASGHIPSTTSRSRFAPRA